MSPLRDAFLDEYGGPPRVSGAEPWRYKVRFAFCKRPEVIREAVKRLNRWGYAEN